MRTLKLTLPRVLQLPPLSSWEKTLLCEYLSTDRMDPGLRERMQEEVARRSSRFIRIRLPEGRVAREDRRVWRMLIRGPFGGWERKGKRIRRKWDPAARRARLRFGLLVEFRRPLKATVVYEDDLLHWWILRLLATREIRKFFECWYCGRISWRERSSARFCNDRCRMRYHLAERNRGRLLRLPKGPRKVTYWKMRRKGAQIGLIDMPIARRSRQAVRRRLRSRQT